MLELRAELVSLQTLTLAAANSERGLQAEMDDVCRRILRMAELLRKMREIAQRN